MSSLVVKVTVFERGRGCKQISDTGCGYHHNSCNCVRLANSTLLFISIYFCLYENFGHYNTVFLSSPHHNPPSSCPPVFPHNNSLRSLFHRNPTTYIPSPPYPFPSHLAFIRSVYKHFNIITSPFSAAHPLLLLPHLSPLFLSYSHYRPSFTSYPSPLPIPFPPAPRPPPLTFSVYQIPIISNLSSPSSIF